MKTQGIRHRDRAAILADINAAGNTVAGTLTEKRRELKGGGTAVYHQLQRWEGGRNVTVHVPEGRVEAVRAGIEGRRRLDALLAELAAAGTAAALSGGADDPVKKKRRRPSGVSRGGSPGRRPPRSPR
jgi:hypothetical protein